MSNWEAVETLAILAAIGPESYQRWQNALPEGEVVRLGRAPRNGWKVGWDIQISREHADLTWQNGQLQVECLETARNPVLVEGKKGSRFRLSVGDSFRIGRTQFLVSASTDEHEILIEEIILEDEEAASESEIDAARRLSYVMRLPLIIGKTRTDEELAEQLTTLLLEALPSARATATVRFKNLGDVDAGRRSMIRWDTRDEGMAPLTPSRRLIREAVYRRKGILHYFLRDGEADSRYTMSQGLDWAICTPIATRGPDCWCLYVAGASGGRTTPDVLRTDLRFTMLMAQFIGSIRQVRELEKLHAGMSQFFSPAVVETLAGEYGAELMVPRVSDITVLFCDVHGFSQMIENASTDLFPLLGRVNAALGMMTKNIVKHDGVIADFQGDAALGFWGWPLAPDDGALPACRAALGIEAGFRRAKADPQHPLHSFNVGIGLAHGEALAGRIGSDEQVKVGVFGPFVNLGSRLEGMTKQFRVSILMDEATAAQARSGLPLEEGRCRRLGRFCPVGVNNALEVSELMPPEGIGSPLTSAQITKFETAVETFASGNWAAAQKLFADLPETDGPRAFYLAFLASHNNTPPPDWSGVVALTRK